MAANEDRVRDSKEPVEIPAYPDAEAPSTAPATKGDGVTLDAYDQVKHTRSASLWSGLVGGAIILLVLLAFIVQNQQNTQIKLLFWEANLPLGVSLLIAAILGALVVGSAGGLRIFQLRRAAKKMRD
ncbi:Lipopolysaccharide assembly protein A domain-containing protein OS=Tsukamurella paurometabola (strain ATCC 8368 / DSM / CCUG 35730 / CIP 100753 / JCM 10117/ KCTC 9821 / NBRC 16120 / NCIMB 702349 / NCTC 13040) OX=521096 GN=Tpau_1677 PE=4 SV=1 [Tsukamurella paurometabola]|uniref:Lipopolysaccharide assembly protein A domain-containing protein n=1 Tax=Tsukamurella paurometabola (strain ATCC 8368 / DSM 20162 / CCUG 35730 / CIP 100753 / JCM 10117 / KCTC 9821 / NBRC 16120 / NCIMB 702349 / NCTC 13040) TaxID=521096 RepID=D5UM16_TSUPD|nr:lipopolysaccharide assembly protein LapA domain-containing protein [Tsukamurella paurometabola]ADG78296.1 conserved hypothetical protein [Tsukamurella paurometabola DSM 20162]SUP31090.1 Uncharacterized integral membrane protein [Tsukamurella paurometabola]